MKQDLLNKKQLLKILWCEVWKGGFQLIQILALLRMYFDAVVVEVKTFLLLFRFALTIQWEKKQYLEIDQLWPGFPGSFFLLHLFSQKDIKWQLFFDKNDEIFTITPSFFTQLKFWMKTVVIWWLFDDDLENKSKRKKDQEIRAYDTVVIT